MRRFVLAMAVGLLVAACGGSGSTATPGGGGGTGSGPTDVPAASLDTGSGGGTAGKPSGAKVQVFDAYNDPAGTPVALDLYPKPIAAAGDTPLASVEFGALTPFFDPTVADDAGDMFLTAYAKGETGDGKAVMSRTETLKGNEVITYVVARGSETMDSGRAGAISQAFFDPSVGGQDAETPAPGKGRVIVSAVGLDNVATDKTARWYVGLGKDCALGVGDTANVRTVISPGSNADNYDVDPGTYTFALYNDKDTGSDTCTSTPVLTGPDVKVDPGKAVLVFIYAPTPDTLKAAAIPLSAP